MKHWHETGDALDFLARVLGEGKRAALATVVRVRGSAYRHEGAKLAVAENGTTAGNVSGGCLEQDVREVALQVIRTGRAELRSYCSRADEIEAWGLAVPPRGPQAGRGGERDDGRQGERRLPRAGRARGRAPGHPPRQGRAP